MNRTLVGALLSVAACSAPPSAVVLSPPPDPPVAPLAAERGFIDLDAQPHAGATGHMFYVFFPADIEPEKKPLFVFFNGGPGYATSLGLLADGTAPKRVDETGAVLANEASFTTLGNVLYLDQRETGFSYDDAPAGAETFDMIEDGVDFARSIVRFLDSHLALRAAPVVLVGESYGGARAQIVLDLALEHAVDPTSPVRDEFQAHFDAIDFEGRGRPHPPSFVARQFVAQVLIQPLAVGVFQQLPSSLPSGKCAYDLRRDDAFCLALGEPALAAIADPEKSAAWLGGALEDVALMRGAARHGIRASNYGLPEPNAAAESTANDALVARLGPLDPGDAYVASGPQSSAEIYDGQITPRAFVRNIRLVATFITNAAFDGVIDSTAIPLALKSVVDDAPRAGVDRPGWFTVALPASDTASAQNVVIRFPTYQAGHMVTLSQAGELRDDVGDFLRQAGISN